MEQFHRRQSQNQTPDPDDESPAPRGSNLMGQARGYANVARQARDNCQQQHSAEEELHRRRNRSGE